MAGKSGAELFSEIQLNRLHVIVIMVSMPTIYVFGLIFKFFSYFWILGFISLLLSPNRLSLTKNDFTIYNCSRRVLRRDRIELSRVVSIELHEARLGQWVRHLGNRKRRYLFYNGKRAMLFRMDDGRELIVSTANAAKWVERIGQLVEMQ